MIAWILDDHEEERSALAEALQNSFQSTVHTSGSLEETLQETKSLDSLQLLISFIPEGKEDETLDFRDQMLEDHPDLVVVFLTRTDLSNWYGRVRKQEAIFYKPLDTEPLFQWISHRYPDQVKEETPEPGQDAEAEAPAEKETPAAIASMTPPENELEPEAPAPEEGSVSEEEEAPSPAELAVMEDTDLVPIPSEPEPEPPAPEPAPVPIAPPAAEAPAEAEASSAEEDSEKIMLGSYELLEILDLNPEYAHYLAIQSGVDRKVGLKRLRSNLFDQPDARERFQAEAKAQASVKHRLIASVYEAHEDHDAVYFTHELLDGESLADMATQKKALSEEKLLAVLRDAAEAGKYLASAELAHRPIDAADIYLGSDGVTRLNNTVQIVPDEARLGESDQLIRLAEAVSPLMNREARENETLPTLFYEMADPAGEDGIETWDDLLEEIRYIERQWKEMSGALTPKKALIYLSTAMGMLIVMVGLILLVANLVRTSSQSKAREFSFMARVAGGPFIYQDGTQVSLEDFWMDEYEVTIAQYAQFLEALRLDPELAARVKHPDQPERKISHEPIFWKSYYEAALEGKDWIFPVGEDTTQSIPVDLNCPVTMVDWWDAWAYAAWRGNRLPTEQEWEKAARGREGNDFPWGDSLVYANANTGIDYPPRLAAASQSAAPVSAEPEMPEEAMAEEEPSMSGGMSAEEPGMGGGMAAPAPDAGMEAPASEDPAADAPAMSTEEPAEPVAAMEPAAGDAEAPAEAEEAAPQQDGYPFWSPVDAMEADISPYFVQGMAGNVSEWTATWAPHPTEAGRDVPVRRGGSFRDVDRLELPTRRFARSADDGDIGTGFRTVRDTPPPTLTP